MSSSPKKITLTHFNKQKLQDCLVIYRGWMMPPDIYQYLFSQLKESGITMLTSPHQYQHYHLLPNWYPDFNQATIPSYWTTDATLASALSLAQKLPSGAYIVKDYVKSRKYEWNDACYLPNINDVAAVSNVINNFITRQGTNLIGGVVFRKFVSLNQLNTHAGQLPLAEEYRLFIWANQIITCDNYWNVSHNVIFSTEEQLWIKQLIQRIDSDFVTLDLARKADGKLIVMELGDGQVSGLQQMNAATFTFNLTTTAT